MDHLKRPSIAKIRIPGSTSNLGPGFDCMGMALTLYNSVTIERINEQPTAMQGQVMVAETAKAFFQVTDLVPHPFKWSISGEVPISRGLGSSVTLRHGVLAGLNELADRPLNATQIFQLSASLEGHPDNASAGAFGGFTCTNANGTLFRAPVDPQIKVVLLIPSQEVLTKSSRKSLPAALPRLDAVRSLGNACLITAAFASRQYEMLRECFEDSFHQPYREHANPGLKEVIQAGTDAGALGGFLSGSGSTIACVALNADAEAISRAMHTAYSIFGESIVRVVQVDNEGAQILEVDS